MVPSHRGQTLSHATELLQAQHPENALSLNSPTDVWSTLSPATTYLNCSHRPNPYPPRPTTIHSPPPPGIGTGIGIDTGTGTDPSTYELPHVLGLPGWHRTSVTPQTSTITHLPSNRPCQPFQHLVVPLSGDQATERSASFVTSHLYGCLFLSASSASALLHEHLTASASPRSASPWFLPARAVDWLKKGLSD